MANGMYDLPLAELQRLQAKCEEAGCEEAAAALGRAIRRKMEEPPAEEGLRIPYPAGTL